MRRIRKAAALLVTLALVVLTCAPARAETRYATLTEVRAYCRERLNRLDGEFEFHYSQELDSMFADGVAINALLVNYGLAFFRYGIDRSTRTVRVNSIQYRQGFKVARLYKNGLENKISGDERTLLDRALAVAAEIEAAGGTELDKERRIHDRICEMTRYKLSDYDPGEIGFTRYDTAMGVFLYGEAECDGYSDAFYLLCSLLGLDAGFQRGEANGGGHLWNTIWLDNRWYFVDVTWDDPGTQGIGADYVSYGYFNISADVLRQDHEWVADYASCPAEEKMNWKIFPCTWGDRGEPAGVYTDAEQTLMWIVAHMMGKRTSCHYMVDGDLTYEGAYQGLRELLARVGPGLKSTPGVDPVEVSGYVLRLQPMEAYGYTVVDIGFSYK